MLLKKEALDRIVAGEITVVFRKWKRPTVKSGGTLTTAAGLLAIESVEIVCETDITEVDARQAGFSSKSELLKQIAVPAEGSIYRIVVHYAGADPRIALRNESDLSQSEVEEILTRLGRLDQASKRGPWTRAFLELIRDNDGVRATELAHMVGVDTEVLKVDVRKLKNLGLTESLQPGYRLSPRGKVVLKRLREG